MKGLSFMKKRNWIGSNLKKIRLLNGLSQEQLIAQLNLLGLDLDRTSLSRIENQNREVYDYELVYFSKALKVNIVDLYDDIDL
ncbi:helix-turn-helix domain-containing protein [Romboutsia ilealis]|uniref:helix-turn-helix domain-containing protein n=2 Tax=Romboutsia TaxID=1501226 RepID=UPI0025A62B2D|nr:helix-turn-helix transcriptional regulator [Romboutsia ilealis]